jgi:hypothetical protein
MAVPQFAAVADSVIIRRHGAGPRPARPASRLPQGEKAARVLSGRAARQIAQDVVHDAAILEVLKFGGRIDAADDREAGDAAV